MKLLVICMMLTFSAAAQSAQDEIVPVKDLIPDIVFDIRYATVNNFTAQKLYTTNEAYLSLGAVTRLKLVHDSLKNITSFNGTNYPAGLGLKIFDGYRPRSVQYLMFEIFPNPIFVADPASGSVHNRGGAVDLSLVDMATGNELQMPTEFDWFGPEADHGYMNLPANVIANRQLLRDMMVNVGGFTLYMAEWWHYSAPGASTLPLLDFQMK
ncbi:MAG: M15 family metallopeptidase [Ignavibacteriales bacterium]|nr:MAG: M15 family metallopeptidase [Ignavibacteriales bacterium]